MIRAEFYLPDGPRGYGEKAPVDTEIEAFLRGELAKLTPDWSILGEELPFQGGADPSHCWVLDPQDGTSAFLRGFRGSSVSIALTRDNQPVLGVVHAPLYPNDSGDTIYGAEGVGLFRNGSPIQPGLTGSPLDTEAVVAVSQDADRRIEYNRGTLKPARYFPIPSIAYRLALAATGEVRAGMSLAPIRALDVAAGHALLLLTGRDLHHLSTPDQPAISYRNDPRLHGVIGGDPAAIGSLTPWRWESYFGPKQDHPLARPSHRLRASGPALSRAQGCLLGQLVGESTRPPGCLTADSELTILLARHLLKDGTRALDLALVEREWQASGNDSQPTAPIFWCCPLGLALSPRKLQGLTLNSQGDLENECVRALLTAISLAMEETGPLEALRRIAETASSPMRALLEGSQTPESRQLRAFQNAFTHLRRGTALQAAVESSRQEQSGPSVVGCLLGAFQGYDSVPQDWRLAVLTYRGRSRPVSHWPVDALRLAEHLLSLRKKS